MKAAGSAEQKAARRVFDDVHDQNVDVRSGAIGVIEFHKAPMDGADFVLLEFAMDAPHRTSLIHEKRAVLHGECGAIVSRIPTDEKEYRRDQPQDDEADVAAPADVGKEMSGVKAHDNGNNGRDECGKLDAGSRESHPDAPDAKAAARAPEADRRHVY